MGSDLVWSSVVVQVKKVGWDMPGYAGLWFGLVVKLLLVNTSVEEVILVFWISLAGKQGEEEGRGSRNVCRVVCLFWSCREVFSSVVVGWWLRLLVCSLGWGWQLVWFAVLGNCGYHR